MGTAWDTSIIISAEVMRRHGQTNGRFPAEGCTPPPGHPCRQDRDTGAHGPDRHCCTPGHSQRTHPPPHSIGLTKVRRKPSNAAWEEGHATPPPPLSPQDPAPSISTCSGYPETC